MRAFVTTAFGRIPRLLAFWEGGLVFYGGFIGAALTAWWYMRKWRMPFLAYADTLIPSLALGHFLGRLGCFSAGCCWGGVAHSHLPWAVRFPPESLAFQTFATRDDPGAFLSPDRLSTLPLHPVQLYEAFGELAIFLVLVLLVRPRKAFHGQVLATWLLSYAVLRTVVEALPGRRRARRHPRLRRRAVDVARDLRGGRGDLGEGARASRRAPPGRGLTLPLRRTGR